MIACAHLHPRSRKGGQPRGMQRFRFGPEKVLQWRRIQVALAEEKLREANTRVRLEKGRVDLVERHRADLASFLASAKSFDAMDLSSTGAFGALLTRTSIAAAQLLTKAQAEHDRRFLEVIEAKRQVELLERLKTKRLGEWNEQAEAEGASQAEEAHRARLLAERRGQQAAPSDCDH